jgi:Patatin-like phospholipase
MNVLAKLLHQAVSDPLSNTDRPVRNYHLLEEEFKHLHSRLPDDYPVQLESEEQRLRAIRSTIHTKGHAALCLSGGGIRSASFALGVFQGLARLGLFRSFDYVSTVSGGGYIGGWLSAWLFRTCRDGGTPDDVFRALAGRDCPGSRSEPEPVRRVREFSNYLDPRLGSLSPDVWSLIATVARNLLLNWLALLPLLAAALLIPRLYFALTMLGTQDWIEREPLFWWSEWLVWTGGFLLVTALLYIVLDLPSVGNQQRSQAAFLTFCFAPLCVATGLFTLYFAWSRALDNSPVTLSALVIIGGVMHTVIWIPVGAFRQRSWKPLTWIAAAASGAAAGFGIWWFAVQLFPTPLARGEIIATLGGPFILAIVGSAGSLFVGVASSETTEEDREWWSRFGGWLLIAIVVWCACSAVVFVGPVVAEGTLRWLGDKLSSPAAGKALLGAITALTGAVAAKSGREPRNGVSKVPAWRRITFAIAAPAFMVLLLVGLASVNVWLLRWADRLAIVPAYAHPDGAGLPEIVLLVLILGVAGMLMSQVVAVNKFSLHGMYCNRLIRAFLGASRPASLRQPNRFTGFDVNDNVLLKDLHQVPRPIHVINLALNRVADSGLAWQERKAESFTVSPLFAGTDALGYRPAELYGGPGGMSLGTAITISGAAACPNMGYHSSPAVTFLLTLFNARLGAWLGNPGDPGRSTWRKSDPVAGAGPLARELFGRTTAANPYVYLSDGGHFDNLGLYEMVSRRCRYIVVSDAGCDPTYSFADLGNAIRRIRIDLGIPIEFPQALGIDAAHIRNGNHHGAMATVRYSVVDGPGQDGVLIYLKATLSGDEPIDVANYHAVHPDFPHETTADQWFGESQFESYRMLGLHTVTAVAGEYDGSAGLAGLAATLATTAIEAPSLQPV